MNPGFTFDSIPIGVIITQDGRISYINDWACRVVGYTFEEITNGSFLDFVHPDDHDQLIARYQDIVNGKMVPEDRRYRIIHKNGDTFWIRFRSEITEYNGKPSLLSFLVDETPNKIYEDTLKKSEEKYRKLVDNLAEGVVVVKAGEICFINKTLREKLGLDSKAVKGMSFLDFIHPDDQLKVLERYEKRIKGEKVPETYEVSLVKPDGEALLCQMRPSLISWEGEPATQTAIRDLTGVKLAEAEKKQLRKRIIRMEKMESLGLLAGGVAHDLNNVLSGIVSYPEILMMNLPSDHRFYKPLELIHSSGQKAAAIVGDLLTLARRGVIASDIVNINKIILDYLKSPEYKKINEYYPNVTINTRMDQELKNISGSTIHLRTSIMNLVSNAAEAQPGGGRVTIVTENKYLHQPIEGYESVREGEYAVVTVEDNGVGINSKDLQRIFEPFYTKKVMGRSGTGLGMAVVWGTVQDHQGYINVKSRKNKGTKFYLYFPVVQQEIAGRKKATSMDEYSGENETILVVDDMKDQRHVASAILTQLNYTVEAVSSGEAAVEYLKVNACDLVMLDMIMEPGIDGLETFKRIRKFNPGQKVIIVSGFSETNRVKEAQKLGVRQYIKKPYAIDHVGMAIKKELNED